MPKLTLPIINEYPAITRRVAMQLLRTILEHLGISQDVYISYKGENNPNVVWSSETRVFRSVQEVQDSDRFGHGDKIELEVREEYSDMGYNRNILNDVQYPPIWYEPKLNIQLRPHYIGKQVELSITYKTRTPEAASELLSQLTTLLAINRTSLPVSLAYYIIPHQSFLKVLGHLHHLQENNMGYGISFDDWIEQHADSNSFRNLSKLNGVTSAYGFKEVQTEIYAQLEIQSLPEKSKRDGNPGNEVNLVAKIHYEKPYSVTLSYPITVHNQMIDQKLILQPEIMSSQKKDYRMDLAGEMMADVRNIYVDGKYSYTKDTGLTVPLGDDWQQPDYVHPYAVRLTGLVPISAEADDNGERCIGQLTAYKKYLVLSQGLQEYLRDHASGVLYARRGPLYLRAWLRDKVISEDLLRIDEDLFVYTKKPLTQRDQLHITLSSPARMEGISTAFYRELIDYPALAEEMVHQYAKHPVVPIPSQYLLHLKHRYYAQPAYLQTQESMEEFIIRHARTGFYQGLPVKQLGVWHKLILNLLFKVPLNKQFEKYRDYLLLVGKEGIEGSRNLDELYQYLIDQRYVVWDYYKEQHPDEDIVKVRQQFFGWYDLKKLKYILTTGEAINEDTREYLKGWGVRTQAQAYLSINKPD